MSGSVKPEEKALLPNNGIPVKPARPEPEPEPGLRWIPEIGDRRTFVPAAFEGEHQQGLRSIRPDADAKVTGTVIYINEAHRWCRVRFELPGGVPAFECFKF